MSYDTVIRDAMVVLGREVRRLSIGIMDGKVAALEPQIPEDGKETVPAAGLHAFPGVLDAHVHFNDPGRSDWEGVPTGSRALAAGGGTLFIDMPLNSSPPTLDRPGFQAKLTACRGSAWTDFALWGGLTPINLDKLEELADLGVVGFKAFMSGSGIEDFPACDDETLYRGMRTAARLGLPVAVHAENDGMTRALASIARAEGRTGVRDYLGSRPIAAEAEAITRALLLAGEAGCALHIVHTSSARGVQLVRRAADAGSCDATCETCPHYLLLDEEDMAAMGSRAKCAPPLRPAEERRRLLAEVAAGQVDTIGSDHSPAPPGMKNAGDFFAAWGGVSGVQATLRALLTLDLQAPLVGRLTSSNVARRFALPGKGGIRLGADADLVLVDLGESPEVSRDELLDRHRLSPYQGRLLRGAVRRTLLRGRTIFQDGAMVGTPQGKFLRPARD